MAGGTFPNPSAMDDCSVEFTLAVSGANLQVTAIVHRSPGRGAGLGDVFWSLISLLIQSTTRRRDHGAARSPGPAAGPYRK